MMWLESVQFCLQTLELQEQLRAIVQIVVAICSKNQLRIISKTVASDSDENILIPIVYNNCPALIQRRLRFY
jgi:hypothetical protein